MNNSELIKEWQDIYSKVNKKEPPEVFYESGWFRIPSSSQKVRKVQFEKMTETLKSRYENEKNNIDNLEDIINNPTKEDILFVLNDICQNDVDGWELDFGYLKEGLDNKQQKEWVKQCLIKAIDIIKKN